jgi:hypothetical protein
VAIRKSRITASGIAVLAAAATPLLLQPVAHASPQNSTPSATTSASPVTLTTSPVAAPTGSAPAPTPSDSSQTPNTNLALSNFASEVETLGVEQYPASFAEAKLTPAGDTIAYISDPSDTAMISAISALNTSNYPLQFVDVKRSYNQLDALNAQILASAGTLAKEGIVLTEQFPDPASGTIILNYQKPDADSLSELATAQGGTVTGANYAASVASAFQAQFGSDVTLGQEMSGPLTADARNNDTPPFYGGDLIHGPYNCTGGFNVQNSSGSYFMLTAGHCGTGTFSTDEATVGPTSTNWWGGASGSPPYPTYWDVQVIKINSSAGGAGLVWTSPSGAGAVKGSLIPAVGATFQVNGYLTGRRNAEATEVDFIADKIDIDGEYYNATHQVWLENDDPDQVICQEGDSGGPVYEVQAGTQGNVKAVGIVTAGGVYTEDNEIVGYACSATLVPSILSGKNLTLVTG